MDAEMTPERPSALDHLLDPAMWGDAGFRGENVDYIECPPRERVDRARAELAALRRERDDLRMMLRESLAGRITESWDGRGHGFTLHSDRVHFLYAGLRDDGTGLPVLTDQAREALKGTPAP